MHIKVFSQGVDQERLVYLLHLKVVNLGLLSHLPTLSFPGLDVLVFLLASWCVVLYAVLVSFLAIAFFAFEVSLLIFLFTPFLMLE